MPFGLDLKSILIGAVLAYFVLPRIMGFVSGLTNKTAVA